MARAKRTDRAEARRRYRASLEPSVEGDVEEAAEAPVATRPARTAGTAPASAPAPSARPSISSAFRTAFRPIDLRGDLQALPRILRHWSFLLPVILSGLSVALIPLVGLNPFTSAFFQYFSFTAPLGTAFIAGFFAPRASYLVGMLAALASFAFMAIAFTGSFGGLLDSFLDPVTNQPLSHDAARTLVLNQALIVGVPTGGLFAAAAAWYRRFLNRANPNRGRPTAPSGRRPDGKVPKRNQQRPILARRR